MTTMTLPATDAAVAAPIRRPRSSRCATSGGATAPPRCSAASRSTCTAASSSDCSAPTAPARPPPSRSCRASGAPTRGEVSVLGLDPRAAGDQLRRRIGSQLQDAALPDRMRVHEALELFASLHPQPAAPRRAGRRVAADPPAPPALRRAVGRRAPAAVRRPRAGRPPRARVPRRAHPEPRSGRPPPHVGRDPPRARRRHDGRPRHPRRGGGRAAVRPHRGPRPRTGGRRRHPRPRSPATSAAPRRCASPTPTSTSARSGPPGRPRVDPPRDRGGRGGHGPLLAHVGAHLVAAGRPAEDLRADRPTLEERFVALTTPEDHR